MPSPRRDGTSLSNLTENADFETELQDQLTETAHTMFHVGGAMTDGKIAPWDRDVASKEVRCAIIQGTDRELLNEVIQNDFTEVANGLFSPGQEGYLDDNGLLPYDTDAAADAIEAYEAQNGPAR